MASSKKPKKQEREKQKQQKDNKKKNGIQNVVVEAPEVVEIAGSSSSGDDENEGEERKQMSSNGRSQNLISNSRKISATPRKRNRKEKDEDDDGDGDEEEEEEEEEGEEVKMQCRFPMNRIRRIIKSEDADSQIMQDAVFLVNKATEMFIEQFSEDAYECSIKDRKKFLHYKHLSSVVKSDERYEFLSDFVPEKVKAEDALERRKLGEEGAG